MGVVYKAEDTKLDRDVALKFLTPHLLQDAEGGKRFIREAKVAAALNHPNICTVYEIGEVEGETFISMAFIEGESLDKKIEAGPLNLKDALDIALQTAQGLQAAHDKPIVHRDIKPANLMVTETSPSRRRVTIMDFGLARLAGQSKLTLKDTVLGTVAYMSPEQTMGAKLDHRTDIWALGVVIYEMVCGQLPFKGHYHQAVVYSITSEEPEPLTAMRTGVPMELEWIVGKCLAKEADKRYQSTADMVVDLETLSEKLKSGKSTIVLTGAPAGTGASAGPSDAGARVVPPVGQTIVSSQAQAGLPVPLAETSVRAPTQGRLAWLVAALCFVGMLALAFLYFRQTPPEAPLRRFAFTPPEAVAASASFDTNVAISPNGKHIAFIAGDEDRKLWVQDLDQRRPRAIDGTEGAVNPFWSPGSDFIGFAAGRELKKVSVRGGPVIRLCEMPSRLFVGGSWSPDSDSMVFSSGLPVLYEVPVRGGSPNLLISPEPSESSPGEASVRLTEKYFRPISCRLKPGNASWFLHSGLRAGAPWWSKTSRPATERFWDPA